MSLPLATHTVSPVTQFEAHELTTSGVGISGVTSAPPSRTTRCTPLPCTFVPVHVPAGRYAVTPVGPGSTDIDPVGNPQDAMTSRAMHVPAAHEAPGAHAFPHAPQFAASDWRL